LRSQQNLPKVVDRTLGKHYAFAPPVRSIQTTIASPDDDRGEEGNEMATDNITTTGTLSLAPSIERHRVSPTSSTGTYLVTGKHAGARIDISRYTAGPIFAGCTGEVRPDVVDCRALLAYQPSPMSWQIETTTTTNHGVFAGVTNDIRTRVGPPPPRRPSV
jgi:hypothetical protein